MTIIIIFSNSRAIILALCRAYIDYNMFGGMAIWAFRKWHEWGRSVFRHVGL